MMVHIDPIQVKFEGQGHLWKFTITWWTVFLFWPWVQLLHGLHL